MTLANQIQQKRSHALKLMVYITPISPEILVQNEAFIKYSLLLKIEEMLPVVLEERQ